MRSLLISVIFAALCCMPITYTNALGDTAASGTASSSNNEEPDVSGPHRECMNGCMHERRHCARDCRGQPYESCEVGCNRNYGHCVSGCNGHHH